ncbi:hypothetical protein RhiJN_08206 [Ceratobasidium sp. AG-Ba]|nr:hypothetical protein RhiJN_08206 [Ceratobasidium sp. AG-Ba]QRW08990.1 hypothetical protein RhiLY_07989 [Ceratobasidium sp. AG-Ba]
MRSNTFLALFLFAILSMLQLTFAEPIPADGLVERQSTGIDIDPVFNNPQTPFAGGAPDSAAKADKAICPATVVEIGSAALPDIGATAPSAAPAPATDAIVKDAVLGDGTAARVEAAAGLATIAFATYLGKFAAAPMVEFAEVAAANA